MPPKPKIIAIVGPTSGGKSELAVRLAKKFNGEIISADSRQIYRGMNIGTGKIEGSWRTVRTNLKSGPGNGKSRRIYFYKSIPHYLIDFASPRARFSAARFQKLANKAVGDIARRGKLPIICGGTAQWINAVVYDQKFPEVKPNSLLRARLEKQSTRQLFSQLKKLDPRRAATIDRANRRRLVRALEIVLTTKKPVSALTGKYPYDILWIGLNPARKILDKKIERRLKQRIKQGMFHEVKTLHKQDVSWKRLESFGLEYKYCALYLQGRLNSEELSTQLLSAIKNYSRRQMTWWKRNQAIHWVESYDEVRRLAQSFSTSRR